MSEKIMVIGNAGKLSAAIDKILRGKGYDVVNIADIKPHYRNSIDLSKKFPVPDINLKFPKK